MASPTCQSAARTHPQGQGAPAAGCAPWRAAGGRRLLPCLHCLLVIGVLALLSACASAPELARIFPGHPPGRAYTEAQAHETLELVARRRALWNERWAAALARCHGRFLASDCAGRVQAERRAVEAELDRVALQARRALREHAAIQRNAEQAGVPATAGDADTPEAVRGIPQERGAR